MDLKIAPYDRHSHEILKRAYKWIDLKRLAEKKRKRRRIEARMDLNGLSCDEPRRKRTRMHKEMKVDGIPVVMPNSREPEFWTPCNDCYKMRMTRPEYADLMCVKCSVHDAIAKGYM